MSTNRFQSLMIEHRKLMTESIVLKVEILHKIRKMRDFNERAKKVLSKSHDVLKMKVAVLSC